MNLKTRFKKKLYKFRYLEQEFLEYEELDSQGRESFMADLRVMHAKLNVYDEALDKPYETSTKKEKKSDSNHRHQDTDQKKSSTDNDQVTPAVKNGHDSQIKKLYRKIAMKLHPDKLSKNLSDEERNALISKFEKITEDYHAGDYTSLLLAIDELNIVLDNYNDEWSNIIDKKITTLSQKISALKKSIYIAYAIASDAEKQKILNAFIKERGWTSNLSAVKKSRKQNSNPGKSLSWARKLGKNN
tara:strand:- start:578 stop:1309 length:732 start_codon:yes stop_codon:yes gene_type:complete